ncbi:MAG: hypothetical protein JXQ72_13685 [Anaerolineae bacterium]|nr:hypothetical protein [Anaerolineae bacterium]
MTHRSRNVQTAHEPHAPQYQWALDSTGEPLHITQAERSGVYRCPLCQRPMIAKLGEIKQHHFAHERLDICTPEKVMQAVVGRWLVRQLQTRLDESRPWMLTWLCALCGEQHSADLLDGVTRLEERYEADGLRADIALRAADGTLRGLVVRQESPNADLLQRAAERAIPVIAVDVALLAGNLAGVMVYNGPCTTRDAANRQGIVTDIAALRDSLVRAVALPPYYIYGPLNEDEGLTHIFMLGKRRLWLPPILWQQAIGGLHHTIHPALQIITQEWPQDDGSTIALYYITARESRAVAVRKFAPGQPVYAKLNSALFHTNRLTAGHVARSFAEV